MESKGINMKKTKLVVTLVAIILFTCALIINAYASEDAIPGASGASGVSGASVASGVSGASAVSAASGASGASGAVKRLALNSNDYIRIQTYNNADNLITDLRGGSIMIPKNDRTYVNTIDGAKVRLGKAYPPDAVDMRYNNIYLKPGSYSYIMSNTDFYYYMMSVSATHRGIKYEISGLSSDNVVTIHYDESLTAISISNVKSNDSYNLRIQRDNEKSVSCAFAPLIDKIAISFNEDRFYVDGVKYVYATNRDGEPQLVNPGGKPVICVYPEPFIANSNGASLSNDGGKPFIDVSPDDWFYDSVDIVNRAEIIKGGFNVFFAPNVSISRGMLATIIHRLENSPQPATRHSFTDVHPGTPHDDAISWAAGAGIFDGLGDNLFLPLEPITREYFMTIIMRYLDYSGFQFKMRLHDASAGITAASFDDFDEISGFAREAMDKAISFGFAKGNEDNALKPREIVSKAEVTSIVARIIQER